METDNALVFDQHPLIRNTLRHLLEARCFSVIETPCEVELIQKAAEKKPAIITVDIASPVNSIGILIRQLRGAAPQARILVMTSLPTEHYSSCCIDAGASGIVSKKVEMACLNAAIDAVIHDYLFVPAGDLLGKAKVATLFKRKKPGTLECLTRREKGVLYKLLQETPLVKIAKDMGVSIKTVSTYKYRLFRKLGVTNIIELSQWLKRVSFNNNV